MDSKTSKTYSILSQIFRSVVLKGIPPRGRIFKMIESCCHNRSDTYAFTYTSFFNLFLFTEIPTRKGFLNGQSTKSNRKMRFAFSWHGGLISFFSPSFIRPLFLYDNAISSQKHFSDQNKSFASFSFSFSLHLNNIRVEKIIFLIK